MPRPGARLALACLLLLGALGAFACAPAGPPPASEEGQLPRRIAVLGPSTVETLYALGQGGLVVAVSDYCVEAAAAELPRLGGQLDPSLERLAAADPDLVLVQGEHPRVADWCRRSGIRFRSFQTDSVAGWVEETGALGQLLGAEEEAAALIEQVGAELARIEAMGAAAGTRADGARPAATRPTALLVVSRSPETATSLLVAGSSSFLHELLVLAGGRNLVEANPRDYFDLNEEALAVADPDLILEFHPPAGDALAAWRRSFPELRAVRAGRVHRLDQDFVLLPGPRMVQTARLLQELLARP